MSEHNAYTIQLASKVSGVGIHTIRAWEKRYNAVTPRRNDSGRREYSQSEVERLRLLCDLCTLGHTIGQIARLETDQLKRMLAELGKQTQSIHSEATMLAPTVNLADSLSNMMLALEGYKLDIMVHEINKINLVVGPRDMALKVLVPLLREVGLKVARGQLSLSQESALISLLRFQVGHTLYRSQSKNKMGKIAVICTPEGERDEMPILQSALLAEHYQHALIYLGTGIPCGALLDVIQSTQAQTVILMMPMLAENAGMIQNDKYIEKVLESLKDGSRLIINKAQSYHPEKFLKEKKLIQVGGLFELDKLLASN